MKFNYPFQICNCLKSFAYSTIYIALFLICLSIPSVLAQIDPIAQARIIKNTVNIGMNKFSIKTNGVKIKVNKTKITDLKNTVKSKLTTTNELLDEGNKVRSDVFEDLKKHHKQEKEEIDKLLRVNNNIMTSGVLKQIRTTYKRIKEVQNKGMNNLSSKHISENKRKMCKTGFNSIYDEAKTLYDDYKLVKLNEKLQMSDSERLTHLKEIRKEMTHILKLMTYWKNKSERLGQVSKIIVEEKKSLNRMIGK